MASISSRSFTTFHEHPTFQMWERPYLETGSWKTKMESMPFPFVSGKIVVYLPSFQQTTGTYANRTNRTWDKSGAQDDRTLLPPQATSERNARRICAIMWLCLKKALTLPVWRCKRRLPTVPHTLLCSRTTWDDTQGDALGRTAHAPICSPNHHPPLDEPVIIRPS